jgi:hypothetical protein
MHCPSSVSYLINSRDIQFLCPITEVSCALQNQVFPLSALLPMLYLLQSISTTHVVSFTVHLKKSKIFRVYLVRLLPLVRLV